MVDANLISLLIPALIMVCPAKLPVDVNKLADAIYKAEGGAKTNFPYGVRSIDTKGNKEYAQKICLNSIRNAQKRWKKAGEPEDFVTFMGRRYIPPKENPNWVRLVKYFYKTEMEKQK
jgi:hypothetical protein